MQANAKNNEEMPAKIFPAREFSAQKPFFQ